MKTFARSLQTKGVYAVHCEIRDEAIDCTLLALHGDQKPIAALLNSDTGERFQVELPSYKGTLWNYTIRRVNDTTAV